MQAEATLLTIPYYIVEEKSTMLDEIYPLLRIFRTHHEADIRECWSTETNFELQLTSVSLECRTDVR